MTPRTRLESFRSRQQPSTAAEHTRTSGFQLKLPGKPLVPKLGLSSLSIGGSAKNVVQVKATKDSKTILLCAGEPVEATEDAKQLQVRLGRHTHNEHDLSFIPTRFSAQNAFSLPTLATPHLATCVLTRLDYILDLT